jgi:hypothetical protein
MHYHVKILHQVAQLSVRQINAPCCQVRGVKQKYQDCGIIIGVEQVNKSVAA